MPTITQAPQTRPHSAPAHYHARPASWRITALHRQAHQLKSAFTRRARRLHLPRLADYKLGPMPRMRWYS
jgi:hypothetical protein